MLASRIQLFSNPPRYPELQLPGPNAFIPADLETLRPKPATPVDAVSPPPQLHDVCRVSLGALTPRRIRGRWSGARQSKRGVPVRLLDTPGTTLWFKQDDVYFVPKSAVSVLLITYAPAAKQADVGRPAPPHRPRANRA